MQKCKFEKQKDFMGAQSLDMEFNQYWLLLSPVEKQSLLSVAKHYVELKEEAAPITIDQYNQELDAAMIRIDNGQFIAQDQVKTQSQNWLNGK